MVVVLKRSQEIRRSNLSKSMEVRHQQSESRYEAQLAQIVKRAGDEATKVGGPPPSNP